MNHIPVLALWALAATSQAQELTIHEGWLLEPVPGTFYENGIGSPTVAYDAANDLWVMYFETRYGGATDSCRQGVWGIGRATSRDGLSWTIDPDLVIEPETGTYHACVIAHPTVIYDGTTWHVWFKAHQNNDACADTDRPPWGCNPITGVGYATSSNGVDFELTDEPIIGNIPSFGFPTVTIVDGVHRMLLASATPSPRGIIYELFQSISTDGGTTWSIPTFVLGPGFATWVEDEIYNPALTCDPRGAFPYVLWAGGRDRLPGVVEPVTAGIGRAFSDDAVNWLWDGTEAFIEWDLAPEPPALPDRDWRHWDVVRIGRETLLFFSERDDSGRNRIGLAYTWDTQQTGFDEGRIGNRICDLGGVDTGTDTDADTDTDDTDPDTDTDTDDTDTDTEADTDDGPADDDDGRGCGCVSAAPGGGWWLLGVPWLLRRRRAR